jgi:hypothetical protein
MTKMRVPDSFEEAALETVRLLTASEAAKVAGLSPQTLRDYSDADRPGRPTLHTALALDSVAYERTGRAPFFESYTRQLAAKTRGNERPVGDVMSEALDLPGAVGRLLDLIRRSSAVDRGSGSKISAADGSAIMKAIKVQRRELDDVEAAVAAATEDGRPAERETSNGSTNGTPTSSAGGAPGGTAGGTPNASRPSGTHTQG